MLWPGGMHEARCRASERCSFPFGPFLTLRFASFAHFAVVYLFPDACWSSRPVQFRYLIRARHCARSNDIVITTRMIKLLDFALHLNASLLFGWKAGRGMGVKRLAGSRALDVWSIEPGVCLCLCTVNAHARLSASHLRTDGSPPLLCSSLNAFEKTS